MNTSRQISNIIWLNLLVLVSVLSTIHLSADTESLGKNLEDFKGLWITEINDEAIFLLIKKNHLASYFYKDRIDNSVYRAEWKLTEAGNLSVSSSDFNELLFSLEIEDSVSINSHNRKKSISILNKVPDETLGEWARPPDYERPKNKYIPSNYFGLWETQGPQNQRIIKIWNNRNVLKRDKEASVTSQQAFIQGEWYKHGQQLHIAWEDGSYTIIDNRDENRVKLLDFGPGAAIIEKEADYELIKKIRNSTDDSYWSKNQKILTQKNNISLSQFDYKSLLKFYRGEWITLDETQPNAFEIMKFNRFGGVNLVSDPKIKGNWYLSGKRCLINLEDGIRMRLKYIGSAFLIFLYKPNRPLDGFPNKILKAAPLDRIKLNVLNSEIIFTLKLLEQVDRSFPLKGKPLSLMSDMSDRYTINPNPSSPWWWPIWIDNQKIKEADTFPKNKLSPSLTNGVDSIGSTKEVNQSKLLSPLDKIKKSKWKWPF